MNSATDKARNGWNVVRQKGTLGEVITGDGILAPEWGPFAEALENGGYINPDEITIVGHGTNDSLEYRKSLRPASEYAEILRGRVKPGDTIRIYSCNVGKKGGFAQELSRILNVKVIAPNNFINYNSAGEHGLFTIGKYDDYGVTNGGFETYVNGVKQ
ncbi:hypothetical protein [Agarilytica rhodophyticola]|uniref:hypothetical protein n=1 Tax=Agarilytica rhodophyticola TaxID=1737490 RepID=UPI000B343EC2|nr:hypothetical protein [Agarilytica rhodophyticola]